MNENQLDFSKIQDKQTKSSFQDMKEYINKTTISGKNMKSEPLNDDDDSTEFVKVTSSSIKSKSSKNKKIKNLKITENYFYESDNEIKKNELLIDGKREGNLILTPNFDSGSNDQNNHFQNMSEILDNSSIEKTKKKLKKNSNFFNKSEEDQNEKNKNTEDQCSLSFKSFKS